MATLTDRKRAGAATPNRVVIDALLLVLGAADLFSLLVWLRGPQQPPFGDFFAFWSFGQFVQLAGPAVYDPHALQTFQHQLDPTFTGVYPCPYPPIFLLVLVPLGWLPLAPAYVIWIAATLALYIVATLGRRVLSRWALALLVAPTTLITLVYGQNGFLTAALLVGGLRCLQRASVCGGLLLAGLAYKPQFAMLLPVILLAERNWRAIAAAASALALAVLASIATFGWSIWPAWWHTMRGYQGLVEEQIALSHTMPTLIAGLHMLGTPAIIADGAQLLLALGVVVAIWRMAAKGLGARSIVASLFAVVLATPYALLYDMPMITAAMVLEAERRRRRGIGFLPAEIAVVAFFFISLLAMAKTSVPLVAVALMLTMFARLVCEPRD